MKKAPPLTKCPPPHQKGLIPIISDSPLVRQKMSIFHFKISFSINLNRFESSFKLKQIKNQEISHSSNFVSPHYFFSQLLVFAQRPRFRSCSLLLHLILNFVLKSVHKTDSMWLSRTFSDASFLVLSTIVGFSFELI